MKSLSGRIRPILSFVPKGVKLRPVQVEVLTWLESNWKSGDVFTLDLPVGAGKSLCAYIIGLWSSHLKLSSITLVPENALLDQYVKSFPNLPSLYRKSHYQCGAMRTSCAEVKRIKKKHCGGCGYVKGLRKFRAMPYGVTNYHLAMAHKIKRDVLVCDEAHNLVSYLQDLAATKVWQHKWKWPNSIRNYGDVKRWVDSLEEGKDDSLPLSSLRSVFAAKGPSYLIKRTEEPYGIGGIERPVLNLIPLDVSGHRTGDWLRNQSKLVLMSATLGDQDIKDLGLSRRRVRRFSSNSPIPVENRPVYVDPSLRLSASYIKESLPQVIEKIRALVEHHEGEGGLIHAPYSLAKMLRGSDLKDDPRLLWHNKETKREAVQELRDSPGKVLISSGLYEGLDLKGDDFTWQAIVKIPWPYLGDPAIKWKSDEDPEWYSWQASRLILQACGRICRGEDDFGATYILDNSFNRLYNDYRHHFPKWWQDSVEYLT